jgi:hypothetical protein
MLKLGNILKKKYLIGNELLYLIFDMIVFYM